jgi:hypothetical protein
MTNFNSYRTRDPIERAGRSDPAAPAGLWIWGIRRRDDGVRMFRTWELALEW